MPAVEKLQFALNAAKNSSLVYALWYLALAFLFWLSLYVLFRRFMARRKISGRWPRFAQMRRETWHSLRSVMVYGLVTIPIIYAILCGWTRMYFRIEHFGWIWFAASIVVMIFIHDAYFYWTHRLMHHPRLFRIFHRTHHRSTDPSPWAAYAFSPWEAAVQAGIAPLILFTVPVHPNAFALFMTWQISFNVLGHCGYEVFPRWFLRSPLGYFVNTVTHHQLHHEKFRGNYGLYFNFWDRLIGTNCPEYESRFTQATARPAR